MIKLSSTTRNEVGLSVVLSFFPPTPGAVPNVVILSLFGLSASALVASFENFRVPSVRIVATSSVAFVSVDPSGFVSTYVTVFVLGDPSSLK